MDWNAPFGGGQSAQSSTEYLLILGGAAALIAIVSVVVLGVLGSGQGGINCNFGNVQQNIVLPPDGVNITKPTACSKANFTTSGGTINIEFSFGSQATKYDLKVSKSGGGATLCDRPFSANPANTLDFQSNGGKKTTTCSFISATAGNYDVTITVFTDSTQSSTDIAKESVVVK